MVSLEREILWIVARINEDAAVINNFRSAAEHVEYFWLNGHIDESIGTLEAFDAAHGASFWSVQLRIALENASGGLEKQKKYTSEVRSIYKSGLLNFIAYNTSVRNEGRVGIHKFREDIRQKINNHSKYDPSVKTYMLHRMMGEWPTSIEGVADVLRVEQSHSLVDVYETFISLIQHVISNPVASEIQKAVKVALTQVEGVNDFRLSKARLFFGIHKELNNLHLRPVAGIDALFSGRLVEATKILHEQRRSTIVDAWTHIYSGMIYSQTKCYSTRSIPQAISKLIGQILRQDATSVDAYAMLLKMLVNLSGLPIAVAIYSFVRIIYREFPDELWRPELVSLNTPCVGSEDVGIAVERDESAICKCWSLLSHPEGSPGDGSYLERIFRACGFIRAKAFEQALQVMGDVLTSNCKKAPGIEIPLILHANYSAGNKGEVIRLIANEGATSPSRLGFIPIKNSLNSYSTIDFDGVSDWLVAPTALHMLWNITENEATASHLRFKVGKIIRLKEFRSPAKVVDLKGKVPDHLLVYFLREVCIPSLIDQARVVSTTAAILDQRMDVCSVLRSLDPQNSSKYEDEILDITNREVLEAGQRIVDGTRIHVDTDSLARWAGRELVEDFYRYRDLAKVVTTLEYDDVMEGLLVDGQLPNTTPVFDEADAVLYSLLSKIKNEFLNNSLFGLDYYLSKRIRHQSFVGLIRGPLQLQNIITKKEADDKGYNENATWLEKFKDCNKENLYSLSKLFQKLSTDFDNALLVAKDNKLQIKNKEHPLGVFDIEISPQIIPVIRVLLQDHDLQGFVKGTLALLWAYLEKSLGDARKLLAEELKSELSYIFDEFRAQSKKLVEGSSSQHDLDRAVGDCSVEVQLALDDAASWFHKINDADTLGRTFDISQALEISIKAAKKCLRGFEPEIETKFSCDDVRVMPSTLVLLHDVLFVSLDNARVHSGLKKPTITITVAPDLEQEIFSIDVSCNSKPSIRQAAEKKLAEIREKIDRGEYDTKTKTEGGSGLYKIAAVVKQSSKGEMSFGFKADGQFSISVIYNFLIQTRQAAEA
ncbi:hypothetical protein DLD99_14550 [Pseudomonas kribbensis]|uniref:Uncharacterized protein n=2 Tax=Pseudomonas kribbensis TaxID=1628086 RepID=A0A345RQS2_9PSED|nr:hypothetical protein DLD99_14550 [Pseudomonas kribbensis]